jgi:hypothetical protein
MTTHLNQHPHAVINYDGLVTNILVFNECDDTELIDSLRSGGSLNAYQVISCCNTGQSAQIGGFWDGTDFYPPKPYPSWVIDTMTRQWKAPVEMPTDAVYIWDEPTGDWVYLKDL